MIPPPFQLGYAEILSVVANGVAVVEATTLPLHDTFDTKQDYFCDLLGMRNKEFINLQLLHELLQLECACQVLGQNKMRTHVAFLASLSWRTCDADKIYAEQAFVKFFSAFFQAPITNEPEVQHDDLKLFISEQAYLEESKGRDKATQGELFEGVTLSTMCEKVAHSLVSLYPTKRTQVVDSLSQPREYLKINHIGTRVLALLRMVE